VEEGRGRLLPGAAVVKLKRFLIVEDGREYSDRFGRFLSSEFSFARAASFAEALPLIGSCDGLLLDLDFRRTDKAFLVDEQGKPAAAGAAEVQGILILRALRKQGCTLAALLFADFDDARRIQRLETELAPLKVIDSSESLPTLAQRLRETTR
jgi:hypothetical protein